MKHFITLLAVVVMVVTSASCQKEGGAPATVEPITGHSTFTATIAAPAEEPDDKTTIDDNGRQTWRAGDQILVSNGKRYLNIADDGVLSAPDSEYDAEKRRLSYNNEIVAEWITITSDMISQDGKTLTFTRNVANPWSSGKFCFFVTGATPYVYSMNGSGQVSTRRIAEVSATREEQVPQLIASCAKDETHISFKNTLAFVSFKSSFDYYAATIIPNYKDDDDEKVNTGSTYRLNPDLTGYETQSNKSRLLKNAGVSAIIANNHDAWLLPLTSGYSFTHGFTFILWNNSEDYEWAKEKNIKQIRDKANWTGSPVFITTSNSFTPVRGDIIDLGDVCERFSYYARWQAGKSITIDGVAYNKNTDPFSEATVTRVTSNQNIAGPGVYFVKDGVTVTLSANVEGDVIIMGDTVGTGLVGARGAELATSSGKCFQSGTVILKGLTVTHNGDSMFNGASTVVIDDCYVKTVSYIYLATIPNDANVDKFAVVNSDIIVRQGVINSLNLGSRTIGTLKFSNSVLSRSEAVGSAGICQGGSTTEVENCILTGNTLINFAHPGDIEKQKFSYDALQLKSVGSFTATNNYFYLANDGQQVNLNCVAYTECSISGNHSTGYTEVVSGKTYGVKFHMGSSWPSDDTVVESQFTELSLTAGSENFSLNTTEYGAQR